ncbi:MAG TPA: SOS response-associated peptidase [Stellaceae bacterium]|nr:SOS response-associated peptidase [Stellaceae bacterium]
MCGRFLNKLPAAEIARIFATRTPLPNYPARYNLAPTDAVLAARYNPETKMRALDPLRWGLVPHWATDLSFGARCINARAETVAKTAAFRDAFRARRCLIPASGFYEWRKSAKTRTPYAILPKDEPLFAFAGLWENWRDAAGGGSWIRTCTIITCNANPLLMPIHERMPVILGEQDWACWLGEAPATPEQLLALLRPFPAERMRLYPVAPRVNSVKNDDPSLIDPVMAEGGIAV